MQMIGMRFEGIHRDAFLRWGQNEDVATYAVLAADWQPDASRTHEDPAHFDDLPSLPEAFTAFADAPPDELPALYATFAAHEVGEVPTAHAELLQQLGQSHRLGVVSNICGDPARWREHFAAVGLGSAFTGTVFSSEGRSIKPSPRLFHEALAAMPDAQNILFVGDSWDRDMVPVKQLGWATAWISAVSSDDVDCVIPSLLALPSVDVQA